MSILVHLCCGPCAVFPLARLREQGFALTGFFYNPNIHPFQEFRRRLQAVEVVSRVMAVEVETIRDYGLREFLRQVVFHENDRCGICYRLRLTAAARRARDTGADAFTTTLLYSRYQQHERIRRLGEELAGQYGIPFHYQDFREGWQQGIDRSLEMGLYRQPYCGCIYSEQERYDRGFRKKRARQDRQPSRR